MTMNTNRVVARLRTIAVKDDWGKEAFVKKQKVLKDALVSVLKPLCAKYGWKLETLHDYVEGVHLGITAPALEGDTHSANVLFKFLSVKEAARTRAEYRNYWPIAQGVQRRQPDGMVLLYVSPTLGTMDLRTVPAIKKLAKTLPDFVAKVKKSGYTHVD